MRDVYRKANETSQHMTRNQLDVTNGIHHVGRGITHDLLIVGFFWFWGTPKEYIECCREDFYLRS
jgi:hypothetical protein